jgi:hypothetical protein
MSQHSPALARVLEALSVLRIKWHPNLVNRPKSVIDNSISIRHGRLVMGHPDFDAERNSGVGALGLPRVDGIAVQAVFAIFLLLLPAALFLFFAFLAAIAHGKKSSLRLV